MGCSNRALADTVGAWTTNRLEDIPPDAPPRVVDHWPVVLPPERPSFQEVLTSVSPAFPEETRTSALARLFYQRFGFMPQAFSPMEQSASGPFTLVTPAENRVTLEDIIGLDRPKALFTRLIQRELQYRHFFEEIYDQDPDAKRSSILLYGPPGNGKTLLAKAVAGEAHGAFISVETPRLIDTYIGTGPANVEKLKQLINACQTPLVVVFWDEFDAVGVRYGAQSGGDQERANTINQILTLMEGVHTVAPGQRVVFLAATNRRDLIDTALLSRFTYQIGVPCPELDERRMHFQKHLRQKRLVPYEGPDKALQVDWERMVTMTEGLSGREIRNVFIQLKDQVLSALDETTLRDLNYNRERRRRFKLTFTQPQLLEALSVGLTQRVSGRDDNVEK